MKVVVTGGAGFIGARLSSHLRERGHDVTTVGHHGSEDLVLNLLDRSAMETMAATVEKSTLVHLAWDVRASDYGSSPENRRWLNASLALIRLLADRDGEGLAIAGTCLEYGAAARPLRESDSLAPANAYAAAKSTLFESARRIVDTRVPVASARIFFPYGPGEPRRKLVSSLVDAVAKGEVPSIAEPDRSIDYIYVDDVAEALARIVEGRIDGAVNVGSGTGITPHEIALTVARRLRPSMLHAVEQIPGESQSRSRIIADVTRMRELLGEWPMTSFEEGLEAMLKA